MNAKERAKSMHAFICSCGTPWCPRVKAIASALEEARKDLFDLYEQSLKTNKKQAQEIRSQRKEIEILKSANDFLAKAVDANREKDFDAGAWQMRERASRTADELAKKLRMGCGATALGEFSRQCLSLPLRPETEAKKP